MQNESPQASTTNTNALEIQNTPTTPPPQAARRKVFISYSRSDKRYLERLQMHLKQYVRSNLIDVWDDTKIKAGVDWDQEIVQSLTETRVAVLLVSVTFLASDFIIQNELEPLLKAAKDGSVTILPVVITPCTFSDTPLARIQAVNDPKSPLSRMNTSERDELWVKLVKRIKSILDIH